MRFTNGIWFDREDHSVYNAVEVGNVAYPEDSSIRALCTTRHVANRGDTLNKPTITVSLSSTCPDIIAATATHFKGVKDREARFELFPDVEPPENYGPEAAADKDNAVVLTAGELEARLDTRPSAFNISYRKKGRAGVLTDIGWSCLQYVVAPHDAHVPYPPTASTTIADSYYRSSTIGSNSPYMGWLFTFKPPLRLFTQE
jgi:alpha-D-xyloside xylohydrolase